MLHASTHHRFNSCCAIACSAIIIIADSTCAQDDFGLREMSYSVELYIKANDADAESIREKIVCEIDPKSWSDFGGNGDIVLNKDESVIRVRNSMDVHKEIKNLLILKPGGQQVRSAILGKRRKKMSDLIIANRSLLACRFEMHWYDEVASNVSLLHIAAVNGDPSIVKSLLRHGADPNATDLAGRTAIFYSPNSAVTKILLKCTSDKMHRDSFGESPLYFARSPRQVDVLVNAGYDVRACNNAGDTPLHAAASHDVRDVAVRLIQLGADANATNEHGTSPLGRACEAGHSRFVMTLLKTGGRVDLSLRQDHSLLHKAVSGFCDRRVMRRLVSNGANVNDMSTVWGQSPLHVAAQVGNTDAAKFLLDHGADPQLEDSRGLTAMTIAGRLTVFQNAGDSEFQFSAHRPCASEWAQRNFGKIAIVKMLRDAGL